MNALVLTWGVTKTVLRIYPPQCAQTPQDTAGPSPSDGGNRTARIISYPPQCAQTLQGTTGPSSSDGGNRTARTISLSGRCLFRN